MAKFVEAFEISKRNEGGYVNDPADTGGETYRGISRVFEPKWEGWKLVDELKKKNGGTLKTFYVNDELDKLAHPFYKKKYWNGISADTIKTQAVANQLYDHTLSGLPRTVQMIKDILNKSFKAKFPLNNKMTPEVIAYLNSVDQKTFFNIFKEYRKAMFTYSAAQLPKDHSLYEFFYKFNKKPKATNIKYLKGWLYRVNGFASDTIKEITKTVSENKGTVGIALFFLALATTAFIFRKPIKATLQKWF